MAALDLSKLVKEKKFWVASFLVAWAAALQVLSPLLLCSSQAGSNPVP